MSKQTAVQWLWLNLTDDLIGELSPQQIKSIYQLILQAKEMEKEQIESSYTKGREQWQKYEMESSQSDDVKIPTPRNYYNETYGGGQDV